MKNPLDKPAESLIGYAHIKGSTAIMTYRQIIKPLQGSCRDSFWWWYFCGQVP